MPYIYVISSMAVKNRYKVGRHTGTYAKLCSRYRTSIPDLVVHDFIEYDDPVPVERRILDRLDKYRVPFTSSGNKSEWVQCSLTTIRRAIGTASSTTDQKDSHPCHALTKKGKPCRNKGIHRHGNRYYCGTHIKNVPDDTGWLSSLLNKLKI